MKTVHWLILGFLISCTSASVAEEVTCSNCPHVDANNWHLLTKSHGGTISLLKNLTEHECQFAQARALGLPATEEEKKAAADRHKLAFPECAELIQSESGSSPKNKEIWEEWKRVHPQAEGCILKDGTGGQSWSGTTRIITDGYIETAECFQ